jgi:hypothetical protein
MVNDSPVLAGKASHPNAWMSFSVAPPTGICAGLTSLAPPRIVTTTHNGIEYAMASEPIEFSELANPEFCIITNGFAPANDNPQPIAMASSSRHAYITLSASSAWSNNDDKMEHGTST